MLDFFLGTAERFSITLISTIVLGILVSVIIASNMDDKNTRKEQ